MCPKARPMSVLKRRRASLASIWCLMVHNKPYRSKIRAPGYLHLQAMDHIARGYQLADVAAIIGTMDVVFGEIDR